MSLVLALLTIQIALGALDNLWHHEITERLPAKRAARAELATHALRELCYGVLFGALAWRSWHGAWSFAIAALLLVELAVTLTDFVIEDSTRRLPRLERILHTVLAINFGALLLAFAPILLDWARQPTGVVPSAHGSVWSWFLTACSATVLAWSARNALASLRHFQPAAWERRALKPAIKPNPKRVLISGATGFIGRHVVYALIERGDSVIVLTRTRHKAEYLFGPHANIVTSVEALGNDTRIDAIVNLAGAPLAATWWTERRKHALLAGRLSVTEALVALAARLATRPRTWINASAVGYYGVRNDDAPLHEKAPPQPIFQSELCRRWETAANRASDLGVKVALLRMGVVLGADGGALPALARPVRLGVAAVMGRGRQWVSWIHVDDLVALLLFVLDEETLAGPLNATAPAPVRHAELMEAIAAALRTRPLRIAMPESALRFGLGELAQFFVDGQRVLPERAAALGFHFRYATAGAALENLLASHPGRTVVSSVTS
jgi:uncharacterized protein (TIGR01777 family)